MFALKRIAVLALQIAMFYGTMDTLTLITDAAHEVEL